MRIQTDRCEVCYACVRACPVKAITAKVNEEYPRIHPDRCIGCGDCIQACSPGVISYRKATDTVKHLLRVNRVAAVVDPSISGEFEDITHYRKFVEMIRALGFKYVNEVSFGADLVARNYKKLIEREEGKYFISSNCPSIVAYVERYFPELTGNLAPIVPPMVATAKVVHHRYGHDLKIVYIGPCLQAKNDAIQYGEDGVIDAVITFTELRELFREFNIDEKSMHYSDFDPPIGHKGSLYPISQAFKEIGFMNDELLTTQMLTVDGGRPALHAVKTFGESINTIRHHFNLFYCKGCLMGPGTSPSGNPIYRRSLVTSYARKRLASFDRNLWEEEMKKYGQLDLSRTFHNHDQRLAPPPKEKVREILKLINKGYKSKNLGCAACGYDSCKEFAESVANGLAKTDMCIQYSLKSKKDYINTLKNTNEKLFETQKALKDSEKVARDEQQKSQQSLEMITAVLQELATGVVIVDQSLKIIKSNLRFIDIMGDEAREINEIIPGLEGADLKSFIPYQFYNLFSYVMQNDKPIHNRDVHFNEALLNVSIFTIKKKRLVGGVIRDLQHTDVRSEEVINRITEVIDENLHMVQKIGFLLGEGASKTEKMLNSIIESYNKDSKKEDKSP